MNEQRNKLVTENMGLVVSTARKYQGRGLELDDLVSEGTIGMIKAAEKYGLGYNLVVGANIAGFEKVAEAMMEQGIY